MRRHALLAALALVVLATGCNVLRKKKAPTPPPEPEPVADAAAPIATPASEPDAVNKGNVSRFGNEAKLANESAVLASSVSARISPGDGKVIAVLNKGTPLVKVASHDGSFLVVFDNPTKSGEKLMGWISDSGFKATPAPKVQAAPGAACSESTDCSGGLLCLKDLDDGKKSCKKTCTDDVQCQKGQVCDFDGFVQNSREVRTCNVAPTKPTPTATVAVTSTATATGTSPSGQCVLTLRSTSFNPSKSSCSFHEEVRRNSAVMNFPCAGGPATARFGTHLFSGSADKSTSSFSLRFSEQFAFQRCIVTTTQTISGRPPSLTYSYSERTTSGDCSNVSTCTATGTISAQ